MKKTKVVATIGPNSKDSCVLSEMILKGMNIARINMKHSDHDFAKDIIVKIRKLNEDLNKNVAVMIDLKGPDIMTGKFEGGSAFLNKGDKIRVFMDDILGDSTKLSISFDISSQIKENTTIKLDDGAIELLVLNKKSGYLLCEVIVGGYIEDNKGVNVIDCSIDKPFLSDKDIEDVKFSVENKVDFLALSFVKSLENVLEINDLLITLKDEHIGIISKIETNDAIEEIDAIIKNSDGVIVARGDLGVEIPLERVPQVSKMIVSKCHRYGKVSMIATEGMTSMENKVSPTRAEVSDIANEVIEGVDAIILAGDITRGKYPVRVIEMLSKIIESVESNMDYHEFLDKALRTEKLDITGTIAYSAVETAIRLKSKAIVVPTMSGYSAKKISRFIPNCPVIALCLKSEVARSLTMYYGIYPVVVKELKTFDKMLDIASEKAIELFGDKGTIIIAGGYPFNEVTHTNFMKVSEL